MLMLNATVAETDDGFLVEDVPCISYSFTFLGGAIDPSVFHNYSEFMKRKWLEEVEMNVNSHERLIPASLGDFAAELIKSTALKIWADPAWLPGTPQAESLVVALHSLWAPSSSS